MDELRQSRWCHTFNKGEYTCFFHSLTLNVAFLKHIDAQNILEILRTSGSLHHIQQAMGNEAFNLFLDMGFIINSNTDEYEILETQRTQLKVQSLDLMYLIVADGCNLQCKYCFEDAPTGAHLHHATLMNEKTVEAAISCFAKLVKKYGDNGAEKVIHLYGGEPLLNKKAVRKTAQTVEALIQAGKLPSNTRLVLITNGVLLDGEMAFFLANHGVSIGISIDGPHMINNVNRLAKREAIDPFREAMRGYFLAKEAGAKVGVSATLTPTVIDNFDSVMDFLATEIDISNGISLNILHYNSNYPLSRDYYTNAAKFLLRAFERFREMGVYEERMMRKVSSFVDKSPIYMDCGVGGGQIVVAPDGSIGVCQDFIKPKAYFQGSVFDDEYDPFSAGLFEDWCHRSPLFMHACYDCPAIGICGGGCPASAELKTGSRWNIDDRICPHSKLSLEWLIWQAFSETHAV